MRLAGGDQAVIAEGKLRGYLLSPDHPDGEHKAGRSAIICSVWIVPDGQSRPELVTAIVE